MEYRPRRSSKRWLEQAPEYVLAVYDNRGRTADRYTVLFGGSLYSPEMGSNVQCLSMCEVPTHPQGISMWGEAYTGDRARFGRHIRWLDLPQNVREHVIGRAAN